MTEYFDILDQKGKSTGKTKSRAEAHKACDWHRTVHVWIINSRQELLIQRRSPSLEAHPNLWDISVAGHISAGEDSMATVLKETKEELGIKLDPKNIEYLFTVKHQCILKDGAFISNHLNDVYLAHLDFDPNQLLLQKEEVAEVKFVNFMELQKMIGEKGADFVRHDDEYAKLFAILGKRSWQENKHV